MRLLVALSGALLVGVVLLIWLFLRRRRGQAVPPRTSPHRAPSAEQRKPAGWVVSLITSIVASILSGIVLFIIAPYFASSPPDMEPRQAIIESPQEVVSDPSSGEPHGAPSLASPGQETPAEREAATLHELSPITGGADETGAELQEASRSTATESAIEIETSEHVARWDAGLTEPAQLVAGAETSKERILVEGASAIDSFALLRARELGVPAAVARIRVDGASTSAVISLADLAPATRAVRPRVLIENAVVSEVMELAAPQLVNDEG